jgi:hypothetical protein
MDDDREQDARRMRRSEDTGPGEIAIEHIACGPREPGEDDEPYIPAKEGEAQPTTQDPLRGLQHLARVALVGRARILERASEPVAYVWQDIAVMATIVLLAGGPSGGKTTLLFLLLVARANIGEPVNMLGRVVTPAPPEQSVVLIEGEHGEGSTCRKLMRSCEIAGVNDLALGRVIVVARKSVRIGSPVWDDVVRFVSRGLVSDIAIDTIARVGGGDANNEQEQVTIFDRVAQAIEAAPPGKEPTVWACAHTRKGDAAGLDDVSGSIQRVGQADSVLLVKGEKEGGRTVSSTVTFQKLREEPDDYPTPVAFAIDTGEDGRRSIRLDAARPAKQDREKTGARARATPEQRILDVVRRSPGTYRNPTAIVAAAHVSKGAGLDAVKRLEADRKLTREPCSRCGGNGTIARYDHHEGGECFDCRGSGKGPGYVVTLDPSPAASPGR